MATGSGGETRITTSDAGALLRFANLYSHLEGGDLNLLLRSRGDVSAGDALLTDFVLRDEPAFRQLVSAGPQRASANGGAPIDAARVRFEKMTASFERAPGKIAIRDGVIYNPSIGLTTQGAIDFDAQPDRRQRLVCARLFGQYDADEDPACRPSAQWRKQRRRFRPQLSCARLDERSDADRQSALRDRPGILRRIFGAIRRHDARGGAVDPDETSET